MPDGVNCLTCKYYYITWDPAHPRGCRYFGFKGRQMPSDVVRASSGEPCKMHTLKGGNNTVKG